jgi:very-short-patch-repair endonuclease
VGERDDLLGLVAVAPRGSATPIGLPPGVSALELVDRLPPGAEPSLVVLISWSDVPPQGTVVDDACRHLADVVADRWPDWPGRDRVDPTWLARASRSCREGRSPVLRSLPVSEQIPRMAQLVGGDHAALVLATEDTDPEPTRLFGLVRMGGHLAEATGWVVLLALPAALRGHRELDALGPWLELDSHAGPPTRAGDAADGALARRATVWPVRGRPHPFSRSEQLLAARLAADRELGGLFAWNAVVETARRQAYRVDLLWSEGRVVVEVDGYDTHGGRAAFHHDRERDYELLVSGYLVLRLPHDAVLSDVEIALEKIRDVVRFRRNAAQSP